MKSYFVAIYDRFLFDEVNNKKITIEMLLQLNIDGFSFSAKLLAFSNRKQIYLPLEDSFYGTDIKKEYFIKIDKYYTKVKDDFLKYLKDHLNTKEKLKQFMHNIENPIFIFNYKLLNVFTQKELEAIAKKYFNYHAILNIKNCNAILPIEINGWYINGIEIDTDLDETDYPLLEDVNGEVLTPAELLKVLL